MKKIQNLKMSTDEEIAGPSGIEKQIPAVYIQRRVEVAIERCISNTHYEELLAENNLIALTSSATISDEIMLIRKELYDNTLEILDEKKLVTDEELIHMNEERK